MSKVEDTNSDNQKILIEESLETTNSAVNYRNWFNRTFSQMKKDSLRGAILVLLVSALGTGILSMHNLFHKLGIVFGTILLFVVGI